MGTDSQSGEWTTEIGTVANHEIRIRGYKLEDLIEHVSYPSVVYLTLLGELPTKAQERVLTAALCGIVDHALYAPTTYAARIIASTNHTTIMPAVSAAMLTIGPVTASPQDTGEMIVEVKAAMDDDGISLEDAVVSFVKNAIATKRRIPGLGHPLHPTGDPRAIALEHVARDQGVWGQGCEIVKAVAGAITEIKGRSLPLNIDGMLGGVLTDLGFKPMHMPGLAGISFLPGVIAHSLEEIEQSRSSPLLRVIVDVDYTGKGPRDLDVLV
jgi:citryl-CoA lyase